MQQFVMLLLLLLQGMLQGMQTNPFSDALASV
jgi:hypothetical protein